MPDRTIMVDVGRTGLALAWVVVPAVLATPATPAFADEAAPMEHIWPTLPTYRGLSLEDQIVDHLSEIGNVLGNRLDMLSHDMIGLHVDGRGQRARLRVGTGTGHYLTLRFDSDWHFADGRARVNARVKLGLYGHVVDFKLPAMDVSTDSYHGESMVQVNVPLLERHF
jgi:hypothetical protein